MTIKVGDELPQATFRTMTAEGVQPRTTEEVFKGRKVVLFAVPGAFTPTCHRNHMPGFVTNADQIKAKGIDAIVVTAVNDVFVLNEWVRASGADGKVEFIADGSGEFAKALGLSADLGAAGLGVRSRRYSMVVNDGKVEKLNIEETPGKAEISGADAILTQL
jgi:glutaredoxin/glutathione-dependent peroxiredoxin